MIEKYKKRVKRYTEISTKLKVPITQLGHVKLALVLIAVFHSVLAIDSEHYVRGFVIFLILLVLYFILGSRQKKLILYKANIDRLLTINSTGIKRFNGEWKSFADKGSQFVDLEHPYGADLDIVGKNSLYQWTNMCETPWGRRLLSEALLHPKGNMDDIVIKQEAIYELARKVNFRHRLKLETSKLDITEKEVTQLVHWAKESHELYLKPSFIFIIRLLPVITGIMAILGPLFNIIPSLIFLLCVLIQISVLFVGRKKRGHYLESVHRTKRSLEQLTGVFKVLERFGHQSERLNQMHFSLLNKHKELPSKQIKNLGKVASNISNRRSSVYLVLNIFLLWDYQCCVSLEKWKSVSGIYLKEWFEIIGEFESLSSLALIQGDHPKWIMPKFEKEDSIVHIKAVQVSHPLMGVECISNTIEFSKKNPITLITGSNMSGKSTFLRTIGINLVLAYAGAPVFADDFSCKFMNLYTCMRVSDDLQKNISSFYGELLRIKMITEHLDDNSKVFFLLDEIFKGTNSVDRHLAAKAVIHNFNEKGAVGMVSTHDLELDVIEKESRGQVVNYHFEEFYKEDQIHFDYKLKRGVSTTRNAIFLIKAAGINI